MVAQLQLPASERDRVRVRLSTGPGALTRVQPRLPNPEAPLPAAEIVRTIDAATLKQTLEELRAFPVPGA